MYAVMLADRRRIGRVKGIGIGRVGYGYKIRIG